MATKKEKEEAARAAHKTKLQEQKLRRRREPDLQRAAGAIRLEKPRLLIYCEGENTEPSYFNEFRPANADIKAFGEGYNTLSLVKRAIQLRNEADKADRPYEEVWCVFDRDPPRTNGGGHSAHNFNAAVALAQREGIKLAYSIQAFEYWLVLHFNDHQGGAMSRDDYDGLLNDYLKEFGCSYDGKGEKKVTRQLFDALEAKDTTTGKVRRELACARAERNHDNKSPHANPAAEESTTTVYKLVEILTRK